MQELSTWEKIKAGVTGFFSHALGSIPRSLMFSAVAFGVSAAAGAVIPGADLLGVSHAWEQGPAGIAMLVGKTVAISSVLSGGMGAYMGVKQANAERAAEIEAQAGGPAQERSLGRGQSQDVFTGSPQTGLPKHQQANKQHVSPGFSG